jgi:hypothetical protein
MYAGFRGVHKLGEAYPSHSSHKGSRIVMWQTYMRESLYPLILSNECYLKFAIIVMRRCSYHPCT